MRDLDRRRPSFGAGRHQQHGLRIRMVQLIEGCQCSGVELAQRAAELVGLPLPGPDQALVRARQDLDGLEQLAIRLDRTMVVAVGTEYTTAPGGDATIT